LVNNFEQLGIESKACFLSLAGYAEAEKKLQQKKKVNKTQQAADFLFSYGTQITRMRQIITDFLQIC